MSPKIIETRGDRFISIERQKNTVPKDTTNAAADEGNFVDIQDNYNDKTGETGTRVEVNPFNRTILLMIRFVILLTFFLGFLVNVPFKIRFKRLRKNKRIPEWINKYTRKTLLHTPLLNAGILLITFSIMHFFMIDAILQDQSFTDEIEKKLFEYYFYISLVASLLVILFVYFWQKHLVHIRYIENIFDPMELRQRIFGYSRGFIKNRLWISSAMTTLLPLLIVTVYLLISLTPVSTLDTVEDPQKQVLLGEYYKMIKVISDEGDVNIDSLYYVNAFDNLLMFFGIISGIVISLIYILFFVRWTTADIVNPVRELMFHMKQTGAGKMNNYAIVRTNDEIGNLSEGYNKMTTQIREYIDKISRMNEAYYRFVPRQFLEYLGKDSVEQIDLGDQVQKEMTVLFTDIRNFTEISEEMTPRENFNFINRYLGYMEPVISRNKGFIDKFIGDSIMALFSENPEDAIDAGIEMRKTLVKFNEERKRDGNDAIDSGIGIHTGNLMLGVVGGKGRMDGTVISDAVNLSSRLEGLTKVYGTSIIISEDTLIKIKDPAKYNYRFLDVTKVKGKKQEVYIFEIYDGDSPEMIEKKKSTKELYSKAMDLYKGKKFKEALKIFRDINEQNPDDKVINVYINRCRQIIGEREFHR
ncbi:MAG: hypothetical protein K9I94_05980 [Bacteroidales bacterium]|nr:hypothetical protein [Bacteroidales bacterium]